MNAGHALSCSAIILSTLAATALAAAEPETSVLTVSAALDKPDATAYAGEPLAIRITLKNASDRPLAIPDWDHFAEVVDVRVAITGYPGESGRPEETKSAWEVGTFQRSDFRAVPPGETTFVRTVTPMLPGKTRVTVTVNGPTDTYASLTDGKKQQLKGAWVGRTSTGLTVDIPAQVSPEMKRRYDEVRGRMAELIVPAEQKGRLLAIVAGEKGYFAARFVREQCETLPAGPMRSAAALQLLKLAKYGTAYESAALLLKLMLDAGTDLDIRVAIMEWAVDSLAKKGRVFIAAQAWYTWPEPLQKEARDALQAMTKDQNPYLALKARELVARLETPKP